MIRNILAVIAALVVAAAAIVVAEMIGQIIYPIPQGFNHDDVNVMKAFMEGLPVMAYLIVAAGWMIGSFFAGFAEQTISRKAGLTLPLIVGAILTAAAVWNFVNLPHPAWFVVLGLLIFIPFTLIGHKAAAASSRR